MSLVTVTTIIPAFNGADYLARCIASLRISDFPTKIVVVDNASTDGSVESLRSQVDTVLTLTNNFGFAEAVNPAVFAVLPVVVNRQLVGVLYADRSTPCHTDGLLLRLGRIRDALVHALTLVR